MKEVIRRVSKIPFKSCGRVPHRSSEKDEKLEQRSNTFMILEGSRFATGSKNYAAFDQTSASMIKLQQALAGSLGEAATPNPLHRINFGI